MDIRPLYIIVRGNVNIMTCMILMPVCSPSLVSPTGPDESGPNLVNFKKPLAGKEIDSSNPFSCAEAIFDDCW